MRESITLALFPISTDKIVSDLERSNGLACNFFPDNVRRGRMLILIVPFPEIIFRYRFSRLEDLKEH